MVKHNNTTETTNMKLKWTRIDTGHYIAGVARTTSVSVKRLTYYAEPVWEVMVHNRGEDRILRSHPVRSFKTKRDAVAFLTSKIVDNQLVDTWVHTTGGAYEYVTRDGLVLQIVRVKDSDAPIWRTTVSDGNRVEQVGIHGSTDVAIEILEKVFLDLPFDNII